MMSRSSTTPIVPPNPLKPDVQPRMTGVFPVDRASHRLSAVSFVSPSREQKVSYKTCKRQLAQALHSNPAFEDGMLLDTLEKGVWYPIVHLANLNPSAVGSSHTLMTSNALGTDFVLQQGIYQEIRCMEPYTGETAEQIKVRKSSLDECPSVYVFLGYNGLRWESQDVIEDSWKEWTGARYLYLNLPQEFGLSRIALLRRVAPPDVTLFTYIVLLECDNVTSKNQVFLMDFVQRFRAERGRGFLSVYREAPLGSVSSGDSFRGGYESSTTSCSDFSDDYVHARSPHPYSST